MKTVATMGVMLWAALAPPLVVAQEARLDSRLDGGTRAAVAVIIDSARAAGLPTEALVDKALEGASKRADGTRIVAAVRALAERLRTARAALGPSSSEAEIVAAAGALKAGVESAGLGRLRTAQPQHPLAVALIVLSDLAARGVPPDTALSLVVALVAAGAGDEELIALRRDVASDITAGAPPAVAVSTRARGVMMAIPLRPGSPGGQPGGVVGEAEIPKRPPRPRPPPE